MTTKRGALEEQRERYQEREREREREGGKVNEIVSNHKYPQLNKQINKQTDK